MEVMFKKSKIIVVILLFLVGISLLGVLLFTGNNATIFFKTILVVGVIGLFYGLWFWLERYYKSMKSIFAIKIDEFGITDNISSKSKSLPWNNIKNIELCTRQTKRYKHSMIYIKTQNRTEMIEIDTNLLDTDINKLMELLNKRHDQKGLAQSKK